MPGILDIVMVVAIVGAAGAYLVVKKVRTVRSVQRDWATGHAEVCDQCPAIKIRQAKLKLSSDRK